jgi:2-polyprenyl-3-methyl-5-hydroxy-6-metoxy-1,4-benzoquinol methylase
MTGLMRGVARLLAWRGARQRGQASAAHELCRDEPGDARIDLVRTMTRLLAAKTGSARADAGRALHNAVSHYVASPLIAPTAMSLISPHDQEVVSRLGERLGQFGDEDLERFNELLPWAAMTAAPGNRIVGHAWTSNKRSSINPLIDSRLMAFNRKLPLKGLHVLEAGCFEGIHTIGCVALGARVTAFDGRIENVVKTMARIWAYKLSCNLFLWNAEKSPPPDLPSSWDVLHHIGVLYHLSNPVQHLEILLPRTRLGVLLDSHVASRDSNTLEEMQVRGRTYRYARYAEVHRDVSPFAGLENHAKWLHLDDLLDLLSRHGFADAKVVAEKTERNGRRVTIFCFRRDMHGHPATGATAADPEAQA